jgi:tetratricopeptide (TPR) repeat protein
LELKQEREKRAQQQEVTVPVLPEPEPVKEPTPSRAEPEPKQGEIAPFVPPKPAAEPGTVAETLRALAKRVLAGDDFQALGIASTASDAEVRTAYEAILQEIPEIEPTTANLLHTQQAKRIRSRIEAAHANLRSEEKRRAYSLLRAEEEQDRKAKPSAERALEGERWFRKGKAHLERKHCEGAIEAFGMAAHLDPAQGEYASHLGYALFLSNPKDQVTQREAMEHVASGIKRSPKSELSYLYLGRILKAKGDVDVAKKIFRKALRIKPDFHPAVQELRVLEMRERTGKGMLSKLMGR